MPTPEINIYSPECEAAQKKAQCARAQLRFGSHSPDPDNHRELSPPIPPRHNPPITMCHIPITDLQGDDEDDNEDDNEDDSPPELVDAPPVTQKTLEKPVLEKPVHSTKTIGEIFYWMMNQVISIVWLIVNIVCDILKKVCDMIMGIFRDGELICFRRGTLMMVSALALAALVWMSYQNSSPPSPPTPTPPVPHNKTLPVNQSLPVPSPPEKKKQCKINPEVGQACMYNGKFTKNHANCKNRVDLTGVLYDNHVKSANQTMSNLLKVTGTALTLVGSMYLQHLPFFQVLGPYQLLMTGGVVAGAYVAKEVTAAYDKHHKKNLEKCGTLEMFETTRI